MAKPLDARYGVLAATVASQTNGEPADDQADGATNGQSRGALRATKPRPKKAGKRSEKTRDFKAKLDEPVFERLRLTAHKRGLNMSVLANKILDTNLPHFELRQIDKPSDKASAAE
jgi:ribosome-binding protein aMBF1 (putative translation factor)